MNLLSKDIQDLFDSQLQEWPLAKANFEALKGVESKDFDFSDFKIRVQFNPARIQSSAAKVDTKSIQERKCFLCPQNLPAEQRGAPFKDEYQVLVNPFPIFPVHFTIPAYQHIDQLIFNRYGDMLDLAKEMDGYTIFYNGPKCGASAPDHVHFQAGIKDFLPIEKEIQKVTGGELLYQSDALSVYTIKNYLRNGFLLEAEVKEESIAYFQKIYNLLEIKDGDKEPMMNILTWYNNNKWHSIVFPRKKHRPDCFYAEGDDNLLISPAAVDLGGVFITPLEKDFKKITKNDIENILKEISISDEKMQKLSEKLKVKSEE
ncbi:hypothetical protein GGR21_001157 [Dysgonomonas hofstadii]|uniref:DUF4922 domain-containing protein n=1 Tax=Dysgonomonas hofstadii TaxID=637886 RepID=A0A840CMK4_9BACT|nr:DUF4922 domain-containing protein [Dysgonomonas hofstadii]MBB4035268.1 hypothetical protein [Dysgonomonas hofstadii]